MCGLEVPDVLHAINNAYPNGEVAAFGVNWGESLSTVKDYLADTGVRAPIMMDNQGFANSSPGLSQCYEAAGDPTLTEHFQFRIGDPSIDPPFPLHLLIDKDGIIRYVDRNHRPQELLKVIAEVLAAP